MFVFNVEFSKEVKDLNFGKFAAASSSYSKQFLGGNLKYIAIHHSILCVIKT